ncbi:phosphatidylinositol 4-kinase [Metschnikowia aff. pulcherrima]|uniref:1-phosphatidylinositol 4-kinase n=1 Tax=Metschnikowia aff. pulcherrima TaxID=2163413 RepID=A0A4P6XVP6_9ASCO|nr:phosphatidylinositol 4-kinase [Metschnikowia aff. pulcherrima]
MDFFGVSRGTIRSHAYKKLAQLSISSTSEESDISGKQSLLSQIGKGSSGLSNVAISLNEYEILVALCEGTRQGTVSASKAQLLTQKFRQYLLELPQQQFSEHVFTFLGELPPWLSLAEKITAALVDLTLVSHGFFATEVLDTFMAFVESLFGTCNLELSSYLALLGFMKALTKKPSIFTANESSPKLFQLLDSSIDSVDFLTSAEYYSAYLASYPVTRAYLNHELVADFSPVLLLQALSDLMAGIVCHITLGNTDALLMEILLQMKSQDKQFASRNGHISENDNGYTANGHGPSALGSLASETHSLEFEEPTLDLSSFEFSFIAELSENALKKMELLDRGESFLVYSSIQRLKHGYETKSKLVLVIACGTLMDVVDIDVAKKIFHLTIGIHKVMLDPHLGTAIIQLGSLLIFKDVSVSSALTRAFTTLVANPMLSFTECLAVSKSVGIASRIMSQDTVVTTIYALTNLLFVGSNSLQIQARLRRNTGLRNRGSSFSLEHTGNRLTHTLLNKSSFTGMSFHNFNEQEHAKVCTNAVTAISEVVSACSDESVSTLAVSILTQKMVKLNSLIAPLILQGLVACAPHLPEREFVVLVNMLQNLAVEAFDSHNDDLLKKITDSRTSLARKLAPEHPLYKVCLAETLLAIVSHGDVQELDQHRSHSEISAIGAHISLHLKPLAHLLPDVISGEKPLYVSDNNILYLFRNIWFNLVVHGYSVNSVHAKTYAYELQRIAYNTPPLASELSWNRTETSLELNTVLKRGSSNHNVKDHKHIVGDVLEIPRTMSYSKLMFLAATLFVESLRVKSGDCHTILKYYSDPSMQTSGIEKYLGPIALRVNRNYINLIDRGADKQFSATNIAEQLTSILTLCCHGLSDLQDAAFQCSDLLVNKVPSSLCHHKSLFALFDLLTLLYDSVVDSEVNQYSPKFLFIAEKTGIQLKLPDSYGWRNETFTRLLEKARAWMKFLLLRCNYDTKSLIQSYVSEAEVYLSNTTIRFGVSFALEMAGTIAATDRELVHLPPVVKGSSFNLLPPVISQLSWKSNSVSDIIDKVSFASPEKSEKAFQELRERLTSFRVFISNPDHHVSLKEISELLSQVAGFILVQNSNLAELVRHLVEIPFVAFESSSMRAATAIWGAVMKERPNLSVLVLAEITKNWEHSITLKQGIFSKSFDLSSPEFSKMEYTPSDFEHVSKVAASVSKSFHPHSEVVKLLSSNFEATMNQSDHLLKVFTRFARLGLQNLVNGSLHPYSRFVRFELIKFAFDILNYHTRLGSRSCQRLTETIIDGALSWFRLKSTYPFGSNLLKIKADFTLMKEVAKSLSRINTHKIKVLEQKKSILMLFMDDEISKIDVWLNPSRPMDTRGTYVKSHVTSDNIKLAYSINPQLAINLANRYKIKNLDQSLQKLIVANPVPAIPYPDAVQYFIGVNAETNMPSYHLLFWEPLSPIDAITLFLPPFGENSYILQYTMRSLEHHDVNLTFFYVPQIVQSLRFDRKGYVKRFILETARVSRLFAHQIVWNMMANSYKDEEATIPDSLKPSLDEIQKSMLENFSKEDLAFYKKEFEFFEEVTSISGKLKPYIKKPKAEKKIKIDEEMSKIVVQPGVYLPSNPDGVLVDINRKSGKPLQSHAKAPFMATFKIKKEVEELDDYGKTRKVEIEKWQSAIFKVGDDCRQDVLALQLISVFRTIWLNAGLDLYLFPYRVTATAPGCGVIDVLPNSTSRDMLGREAVNGLYEYYTTKFGPETSIEFQQARNNLVRSLAAYSIVSYLLQFKDRHNGNIMYDDRGHILHIDFGFCFDIVPGGVKFEVAPFKLTKEMVMVLGGSDHTQAYHWFEDLCIKGFLACRPYMETIVRCVTPMLESGLPCFKDTTIKKLKKRFAPNKSEHEAAQYFKGLIRKSYESFYTTGYDEFQRLTNGIPY